MRFTSLSQAVETVESELEAVAAALLAGEPAELQAHSTALRQSAIDFSQFLNVFSPADVRRSGVQPRLLAMARRMAQQREALARRAFIVDRQVACLVPAAVPSAATYGPANGGGPGRGAAVARIYASRAT